ncbi:MAG TPA: hypothetical protein VHU21_26735 [Paraburkholderia sp.]|jgi:hypothetical protein|nr:hypothetical protein [Paraburkholderia sp.]
MADKTGGHWTEEIVLIPWFAICAVLVLGAMVAFGTVWVLNRAGSLIEALARWTQEGR